MSQEKFSRQAILKTRATCECLQARDKARMLTREYDRALAPSGLRITQFSFMVVLLAGPLTIGDLADAVDIDRTTLTRNLTPLERDGCVMLEGGTDARTRIVTLTPKGTRMTLEALELWKQAQAMYAENK